MPASPDGPEPRPAASLEQRCARLTAALRSLRDEPASPTGQKLGRWLNSWRGVGAILDGMTAQGWDVDLQQYPHGWTAKFFLAGPSHPAPGGTGWAVTPWGAVQAAAWQTLTTENPDARLAAPATPKRPNPEGGPAGTL